MTTYNPLWHKKKQVKEETGFQELQIKLEEQSIIRKEKQSEEKEERGVIVIEMF